MSEYFLTGATGVVGSAITRELLSLPDNRVTLLIRAGSDGELDSRLQTLFRFWEFDPVLVGNRVTVLRGDITLPQFGLQPDVFDSLAQRCSHIVHCAALVRMNLPLEEARKSALGAAANVVDLAQRSQRNGSLKKVEVLSTVGVGGNRPGELPEHWITEARTFHNTYEQAKAEAEVRIHHGVMEGLPITVHRPSMVVGDSQSGRVIGFQVFYHLVEFLTGKRTFGIFPSLAGTKLDIVPVNYVAAAVVWSSSRSDTVGRVLHLCSGTNGSISVRELQHQIRAQWVAAGVKLHPITEVPTRLFRAALPLIRTFSPHELQRAIQTLPIFLNYLAEKQSFGNAATSILLEQHGIALPPVEAYLQKILAYYLLTARKSGGAQANELPVSRAK